MPTNLAIDDELLQQALTIGGHRTKRETVNKALARRQGGLRPVLRLQEGTPSQVILEISKHSPLKLFEASDVA